MSIYRVGKAGPENLKLFEIMRGLTGWISSYPKYGWPSGPRWEYMTEKDGFRFEIVHIGQGLT